MAKKKPEKSDKKDAEPLNIQPIGDRVVVERESAEEVTTGGIVLPDTAKDKPARGTVLAVGEGRLLKNGNRVPLQVGVGDRVVFSSYAGDEFKLGDRQLVLMREEDILAILT
ncbi:MAG: co-chaperone GroES [Thermoguttaceae bacterium]|jgi:chaperonin GroES|nr:co-chaperone GroES [Thermoguttaceae bacterium]